MDSGQPVLTYGTKFPTEIWARCWALTSSRDLRRLVFVSRHFRDICQPLLFQNQSFTAPEETGHETWMSTIRELQRSTIRIKKLAASPHVSSVRAWDFQGSFDFPELSEKYRKIANICMVDETYLKVVQAFSTALGAHHNLRSLHLSSVTIDTSFRQAFALLPRLNDLLFAFCEITGRTGAQLTLKSFKLVESVDYRKRYRDRPLHFFAPGPLQRLCLDDSHDGRAMLSSLVDQPLSFDQLVTLSIELPHAATDLVLAFLDRCPQLLTLRISEDGPFATPFQEYLPPTTIPLLQSFTGPRRLAALFIPGRPVSAVKLEDTGPTRKKDAAGTDILRDLTDIANSSAAVLSLSISTPIQHTPEILAAIAIQFPALRELDLAVKGPPSMPILRRASQDYGSDSGGSDGSEAEIDERIIELSDNESLESVESRHRGSDFHVDIKLAGDPPPPPAPLPDILLPGHIYTPSGGVSPPPPAISASTVFASTSDSFPLLLDCLCAPGTSLPTTLVAMRFVKPPYPFTEGSSAAPSLAAQHRAVLAFEAQQPALRELAFGVSDPGERDEYDEYDAVVWTRRGGLWTHRGRKIRSQVHYGD